MYSFLNEDNVDVKKIQQGFSKLVIQGGPPENRRKYVNKLIAKKMCIENPYKSL